MRLPPSSRSGRQCDRLGVAHEGKPMMRDKKRVTRGGSAKVVAADLLVGANGGRKAESFNVRLGNGLGRWRNQTHTRLPWAKGSTVLDVMNAAKGRPHGISFTYTGGGASAFLTGIDELANEGGGKKNWQLGVNTGYADKSFGIYEVQPLDVTFWRFK